MTPANSTVFAVYGQLYNISAPIKSVATANRITTGLTGLAAVISKNDGAFVSTVNTPVEIGSGSGWITLDLTPAEMSYQKLCVSITATNSNAVEIDLVIQTLSLGKFSGRWDEQSPLRFEQIWLDDVILNGLYGLSQNGAQEVYNNLDGSAHFQSTVTQNTNTGTKSICA